RMPRGRNGPLFTVRNGRNRRSGLAALATANLGAWSAAVRVRCGCSVLVLRRGFELGEQFLRRVNGLPSRPRPHVSVSTDLDIHGGLFGLLHRFLGPVRNVRSAPWT